MRLAVDTNVWIPFFKNEKAPDIEKMIEVIYQGGVCLPPPVFSELLSDPSFPEANLKTLKKAHFLTPREGYWERAGFMRAKLIKKGYKPKLPDTLIAQSCIDHDVALLTRDDRFRIFKKHAGLKLA